MLSLKILSGKSLVTKNLNRLPVFLILNWILRKNEVSLAKTELENYSKMKDVVVVLSLKRMVLWHFFTFGTTGPNLGFLFN
jgi:hypothetical protein